jgi:DNA replication and repair protein RecF
MSCLIFRNLMKKRAQELLSAELSSGISLVGPQKHDVIFLYSGNDSRFFSSQGQQRSIILAFKMAQIVYHYRVNGFYPVLLLDDVLSELDQTKQSSLVLALNEIQTQTFLTSTDIEVLKKLNIDRSSVFKVQNGFVQNEK